MREIELLTKFKRKKRLKSFNLKKTTFSEEREDLFATKTDPTDEIEEPKTTSNRISTPHPMRNRPPSILVGSGVNKMISPSLQNSGDSEEPVKRKPYIPPGAVHMGGMPMGGMPKIDLNDLINKRNSMRREPPTPISKVPVYFLNLFSTSIFLHFCYFQKIGCN